MTKVFKIQNIYAIKGIVKNNETTKVCAHKWYTYGKSTKKTSKIDAKRLPK